jgi:hypothetical protein
MMKASEEKEDFALTNFLNLQDKGSDCLIL